MKHRIILASTIVVLLAPFSANAYVLDGLDYGTFRSAEVNFAGMTYDQITAALQGTGGRLATEQEIIALFQSFGIYNNTAEYNDYDKQCKTWSDMVLAFGLPWYFPVTGDGGSFSGVFDAGDGFGLATIDVTSWYAFGRPNEKADDPSWDYGQFWALIEINGSVDDNYDGLVPRGYGFAWVVMPEGTIFNPNPNAVPEPTAMALFGIGLLGICCASRRRK